MNGGEYHFRVTPASGAFTDGALPQPDEPLSHRRKRSLYMLVGLGQSPVRVFTFAIGTLRVLDDSIGRSRLDDSKWR